MSGAAALLHAVRHELARLPPVLDALVGDLDDPSARARPSEDEWSPIEILCHLRDEEAEDFRARLCAVLDGRSTVSPIDPARWAVERGYRDERIRPVLTELGARRRSTLELLGGAAPDRLGGSVTLRGGRTLSGLDLLAAWVAHDRIHLRQLAGTLARLWAARWAPLGSDYAGPIPYGSERTD